MLVAVFEQPPPFVRKAAVSSQKPVQFFFRISILRHSFNEDLAKSCVICMDSWRSLPRSPLISEVSLKTEQTTNIGVGILLITLKLTVCTWTRPLYELISSRRKKSPSCSKASFGYVPFI